jgi:hypothetical protein
MTTAKARNLAKRLLAENGLGEYSVTCDQRIERAFTNRALSECTGEMASAYAGCHFRKQKLIFLSPFYIKTHSADDVLETILHEIAHALGQNRRPPSGVSSIFAFSVGRTKSSATVSPNRDGMKNCGETESDKSLST